MAEESFAEILERSTLRCREADATLAERLQLFADDVRSLSPQFAEIVDRMVARLKASGAGLASPSPGEPMPSFLLPQDGELISLEQLLARGPLVVSFHRGHWCPYCRINADALAKIHPAVAELGAQIVAITPEVEHFTAELKSDARAPFPILTDLDNGYALQLNLAIWINDEKREAMTAAGWDISAFQANDHWTLPIPATFIIGTDGIVKARFVDPDYRKRMPLEDIIQGLGHGDGAIDNRY
jgi:peroxiredoxin